MLRKRRNRSVRAGRNVGADKKWVGLRAFAILLLGVVGTNAMNWQSQELKGYDITPTGLTPIYPPGFICSQLTSLYASWIDVDGTRRNEIHSGVDGGRLGDWILAPGPGAVRAMWQADWGWGPEGALVISHTRHDLNLSDGPELYFSEFDHLSHEEIKHFYPGQKIARGQELARVSRPGGKEEYLPEVHWEVWEIGPNDNLTWSTNKFGGQYWINESARLIDPLYMLSRERPPERDGGVVLTPFLKGRRYTDFRGFTYILPCWPIPG
jgi:hypothetical protein